VTGGLFAGLLLLLKDPSQLSEDQQTPIDRIHKRNFPEFEQKTTLLMS
jgi:hypothetical protein